MAGLAALLAGCATTPAVEIADYPGFLRGLWHGLIAPIAFVGSLFRDQIAIYAFPNSGGWYDLGFLLGLSAWGGGGHAATRR
jgi:hypothetical protein